MNALDAAEVAYKNGYVEGYKNGVKDMYNAIVESDKEESLKLIANLLSAIEHNEANK